MLKRQLGKEVIPKKVKHGEKAEVRQIMQQIEGYNCDSLQSCVKHVGGMGFGTAFQSVVRGIL